MMGRRGSGGRDLSDLYARDYEKMKKPQSPAKERAEEPSPRDRDLGRVREREEGRDTRRDRERETGRDRELGRDRERDRERYDDRGRGYGDSRGQGRDYGDSRDRDRDRDANGRSHDRSSRGYRRSRSRSRDRHSKRSRDDHHSSGSSNRREIPFDRFLRLSPWNGPVCPLEERTRHLKNWDQAPPGFERIGADKAKLTGLFAPPGNVTKNSNYLPPTLDPARAAMMQLLSSNDGPAAANNFSSSNSASSAPNVLSANLLKQAKRFYVGNLPVGFNEHSLRDFLDRNLLSLAASTPSDSSSTDREPRVLQINVSTDRSYAFVDARSAEDASLAMNLDGVLFEGVQLKIRRPKEYHVALTSGLITQDPITHAIVPASGVTGIPTNGTSTAATTAHNFPNSAAIVNNRRLMVLSGIPEVLTETHVKALLLLVADLNNFLLLRDKDTDCSLGVAVFEFIEDEAGSEWSEPLMKHSKGSLFMGPFEMRLHRLVSLFEVSEDRHGEEVLGPETADLKKLLSIYNLQPGWATAPSSTPILQLLNIVTRESLLSDYDAIYEDIRLELSNFIAAATSSSADSTNDPSSISSSLDLVIPKPLKDSKTTVPGVGKVFARFSTVEEAARAASELAGRIFDGKTCIVSFFTVDKFEKGIF